MTSVKVDERKIREIARKLGVSPRTVEEYLLDRLTMQQPQDVRKAFDDQAYVAAAARAQARAREAGRLTELPEEHAG